MSLSIVINPVVCGWPKIGKHYLNLLFEGGDMQRGRCVDNIPVYFEIVVNHDVPHPLDLLPRDLGIPIL